MLWAPYWVYSRALSMVWGQNPPKKVFLAFYYLIWLKTYSWYLFKKSIKTYSWYFSRWWEKYLSKRSLIKHTCSWRDKLIVLWTLNRQAKIFLHIQKFASQKTYTPLFFLYYPLNSISTFFCEDSHFISEWKK